jgi:uncharacterized protein YgiM (DUF1202 family)
MSAINKVVFVVVILISTGSFAQKTSEKLIASCCAAREGRCTGSASCSACSNCSRCGHCNSGGTCGVCSSSTRSTYYYAAPKIPKKKKVRYATDYSTSSAYSNQNAGADTHYDEDGIFSVTTTVNLRKGPSTEFEVIEVLSTGTIVIFKEREGDWAKVEIYRTGSIGYVNIKYLK